LIYTLIGVIILILALILLGILLIPFHISFYLQKSGNEMEGKFKLSWLRIRLIQRDIPQEEEEEKKEKKKKEKEEETKFNASKLIKVVKLLWEALDYLKPIFNAFLNSLTLEKFFLNLNLGFRSPVDTAMTSGYIWSLASVVNLIPPVSLSVVPDFQKQRMDGSVEISIKLKLFWIVVQFIKAFTKKPVRELFWSIRDLNK
jgi:hypothetical protein